MEFRTVPTDSGRMLTLTSRAALCLALVTGCVAPTGALLPPPTLNRYRADGFNWSLVSRVLLVPLFNETPLPTAADEVRVALAAELQNAGLFEVVLAPDHRHQYWSGRVRMQGSFDESELAELGRSFGVDAVLIGTVTQYRPYWPPRIGLVLHLISTDQAVVLASIDGLWDSRDEIVAQAAKRYHHPNLTPYHESLLADDIVLHAPRYYQRFVAYEVARGLAKQLQPPSAVAALPAGPAGPAADPILPAADPVLPAADRDSATADPAQADQWVPVQAEMDLSRSVD